MPGADEEDRGVPIGICFVERRGLDTVALRSTT